MSWRCKWCGREYDANKSAARNNNYYCSGRCEAEAERAKAETERAKAEARAQSGGSDNDGCGWILGKKWFWIIVVAFIIAAMCSNPDEDGKKKEKKTENTETTYVAPASHEWWQRG